MNILKGMGDFFALDIGTSALRVVEVTGAPKNRTLAHYGYLPIDSATSSSSSQESQMKLGEAIKQVVAQAGIKETNVVIGMPSSKTFTTVIDVSSSSESELKSMMPYQMEQHIPMAIDDAKVDWALLGPSLRKQNQQEVLITSVAKEYSERRLEFIESLGFNVVAAEPDPIAMVRSLVLEGNDAPQLLLNMGNQSTDIVVVYQGLPRLVRNIPTGLTSLVSVTAQSLGVQPDQAQQYILKFGLAQDKLDGQVVQALGMTLENYTSEITKSITFFQNSYANAPVQNVVLAGYAGAVPYLDGYVASTTGIQTSLGDPWSGILVQKEYQDQLSAISNEFATVVGLAQRGVV